MRAILYPEGAEHLNVIVPATVKEGLRTVARRQRQSISQLVGMVLEDYLRRRGELPLAAEPRQEKAR